MEIKKKEWHVRISATANCNFKCIYCNPQGLKEKRIQLKEKDIKSVLEASYAAGVKRVHWTGGEPSLVNLLNLVNYAKRLGYHDQIITTNGVLIKNNVRDLIRAGLRRFNLSIDSLDRNNYKDITGVDALEDALQTLNQVVEYSRTVTKINIVALKQNIEELQQFVEFASNINRQNESNPKIALKILELCPNNPIFLDENNKANLIKMHVNRDEIIAELDKKYSFKETKVEGDNPNCDYHLLGNTCVPVGLVTMPSLGYPCGGHENRKLRVSPFGLIGACLAKPAFNYFEMEHQELVSEIIRILKEREDETEADFANRKHYQGNFGMWRFGDCKK